MKTCREIGILPFFQGPEEVERKVYNTHLLIDNLGEIVGKYKKTHLFNVDVPGGAIMKESDYVIPGNEAGKPIETPVGKIGLQVVSFQP